MSLLRLSSSSFSRLSNRKSQFSLATRFLSSAPPCGSACATPDTCDTSGGKDIAWKANNDGWGYTKDYANSYERIFGAKDSDSQSKKDHKED